ncbi:MAG: hypothetical protein AVDCRST_MAG77-2673 [uncultured Chloroflexi bacterium]|uniref:Terminase large subunit gp17-like C-terminal domain-containing protein n=1 Tax=uncultured Chloroflexota bacterium TaxID=166587 RepID=A0A6J4IV81_9CHLR|nr:MAG: hypothetical protein AVDCRST_MAG77-2673 [uncultured Chloroflexota bacterium]
MSDYVHFLGVDLGQSQDFTAIALVEEGQYLPSRAAQLAAGVASERVDGWQWFDADPTTADAGGWALPSAMTLRQLDAARRWTAQYGRPADPPLAVRHLERLPLGTSYPDVVRRVKQLISTAPLQPDTTAVLVDQTGVGRAVCDYFALEGVRVIPVTVTGGIAVTGDAISGLHTPKRDLVGATQVALQQRRLTIARALPDASVLVKELASFKVKITAAANDTYGSWREGEHDDLAFALCLAVWFRGWFNSLLDNDARTRERRASTAEHTPNRPLHRTRSRR